MKLHIINAKLLLYVTKIFASEIIRVTCDCELP